MADSRTLKLSILADIDNLKKNLNAGSNEVEGFGSKLGDFSKKAGLAFAAAGAAAAVYAGKLLIDGVKSAIEDEAAQAKLATTLKNVAGASDSVVASTEAYITKTAIATGVTDDVLRPSLDRLIRSTNNVAEAQRLQSLALDIAAGTGTNLEAVSNALAKAYDGNAAGLAKIGIGLSSTELKSMTFQEVTAALSATFEGQAANAADTFEGKMQRLNVAFSEGKETVGAFVLDAITPLISNLVDNVIPAIGEFSDKVGEGLQPVIVMLGDYVTNTLIPALKGIWAFINDYLIPIFKTVLVPVITSVYGAFNKIRDALVSNQDELQPFYDLVKKVANFIRDVAAPIFGGAFKIALSAIGSIISGLVSGFGNLVGFISDAVSGITKLVNLIKNNPIVSGISGAISGLFGGGKAAGGMVAGGTPYVVGEKGAELFVPQTSGTIIPNNRLGGGSNTVINLNVSGAIDPEGTARTIINTLNNSFYRGTLGAGALVMP
jgi:hypothetical protein